MPAPKPRGRPREFCSSVCVERARRRRSRAAGYLEYEAYLESRAAEIRARGVVCFGGLSAIDLEQHAARLHELAEETLMGLPGWKA